MFDKVKFSLHISSHIIFKICTRIKGMLALEISKEFETRVITRWKFKWKIHQAMKSSKICSLKGEVHIDEFLIGGQEEENRGRDYRKKRLVVLALEIKFKKEKSNNIEIFIIMTTLLANKTVSIEKTLFDIPGKITIKLEDGRIIITPLRYFPELQKLLGINEKNTPSWII